MTSRPCVELRILPYMLVLVSGGEVHSMTTVRILYSTSAKALSWKLISACGDAWIVARGAAWGRLHTCETYVPLQLSVLKDD